MKMLELPHSKKCEVENYGKNHKGTPCWNKAKYDIDGVLHCQLHAKKAAEAA